MKLHHFLIAICLTASAFAQTQSDDSAFLTQFEKTFETADTVQAKDFVTATVMKGRLHSVYPLARNDGMNNTYYIEVGGSYLDVTGTPALLERVREIYAVDYLRGMSKSKAFAKALANAGGAKLESAAGIVTDPIGTLRSVPKGASRFFGRIGEGLKGGASNGEGNAIQGLTGVAKAKAQLAAKLGVNPYSTNQDLQQELTTAARAIAGGGLVVNAATSVASGGVGAALTAAGVNETLRDTLNNSTPEDLRIINRKKLFALGVDRALADEFLMHPWFSPWHESVTTDALATIGLNPSDFLTDAVRALTPEDAFFFQRVAQILAKYHTSTAPLVAIRYEGGLITGRDKNGVLVVPVSLDYGIWSERTARRAEQFVAIDKAKEQITGLALWTDGKLSERLCDELKKRGIAYRINALSAP